MQEKKNAGTRFGSLLRRLEKRLSGFGKGVNIIEKDTMSSLIMNAENGETDELIREMQSEINNEIKFRAHQPLGSITKFERNNLVVSLGETEEKHSTEIFEPFVAKGYAVIPLKDFEPFAEYHVYLVSWK